MNSRRVHLRIRGSVQGVSFRASACAEARRLGLTGWVRNLPTGDVETVAEGPHDLLDAFARWCQRGPDQAQVTSVDRGDDAATHEFTSFTVRA